MRTTLVVVDLCLLGVAASVSWQLRSSLSLWPSDFGAGDELAVSFSPWIIFAWLLLLATHGAYSERVLGAGADEFKLVTHASFYTAGAVGMSAYLLKVELSRGFVFLTFAIGFPLILSGRVLCRKVLRALRSRRVMVRRVVAVGSPEEISELATILHRESYAGYEICGGCVPVELSASELPVPYLGSPKETRKVAEEVGADGVLIAHGAYSSSAELRRFAWDLEGSDLELIVVPSLTDVAGPRIHMRPVAGLPLLHVDAPQFDQAGGAFKRIFDLLGALVALVALSPLLLLLGLLVKLEDGGQILFRQERIGRGGQRFDVLKLRSMVPDAELRLDAVRHLNEGDGALFKVRRDPRMTRIGKFMRRYSLDELPQLVNVVRGDMSLVGPRPPLPAEVDTYEDDMHRRLLVRPGMTGLWQVSGRSTLPWREGVRLDLYYVDNWSMVTDVLIIGRTVKAVLGAKGAY